MYAALLILCLSGSTQCVQIQVDGGPFETVDACIAALEEAAKETKENWAETRKEPIKLSGKCLETPPYDNTTKGPGDPA